MIRRTRIILTEILVASFVVVSVALFWASYYIDTPEFRNKFITTIEAAVGAPVHITDELDIALYPSLSLLVKGVRIDGPPEFGDIPLAEVDELRIGAKLLPLLMNRNLDFDVIDVQGVVANVVRSADGDFNWQMILQRQSDAEKKNTSLSESGINEVTLSGIEVTQGTIRYIDLSDGDTVSLSDFTLRAEDIFSGDPVPFTATSLFTWKKNGIEANFSLDGTLGVVGESQALHLSNARLTTSIGGGFLPEGVKPATLTANLEVDMGQQLADIEDIHFRFLGMQGTGHLKSISLDKGLNARGRFAFIPFTPSSVIDQFAPSLHVDKVNGLESGQFSTDIIVSEEGLELTKAVFALDDQKVEGEIRLKDFTDPEVSVQLVGDKLNVDRYLPMFRSDADAGGPILWKDLHLGMYHAGKWRGSAKFDSVLLAGTTVTDVQTTVDGRGEELVFDVKGTTEQGHMLTARTRTVLKKDRASNISTLQSEISIQALSDKLHFPETYPVRVGGESHLSVDMHLDPTECPPDSPAIDIIRNLRGRVVLVLGPGESAFTGEEQSITVHYDKAECSLEFRPVSGKESEFWFDNIFSIKTLGDKRFRSVSLSASGPVGFSIEDATVFSRDLKVTGRVSGKLYSEYSEQADINGSMAFDTGKHTLSIQDASVSSLGANLTGDLQMMGLDKSFMATGRMSVKANVRRIIYLLTRFHLHTEDEQALKNVELKADVHLDTDGFELTRLKGDLDGVDLEGDVSGKWEKNPKLLFALKAGAFDLDRYLPPDDPKTESAKNTPYEPVDLPLKFFRLLNVRGAAEFDEFKLLDTRVQNLTARFDASKGNIQVLDVNGSVYQGRLTGVWTGIVKPTFLTTALSARVKGMQAAPFMTDVAGRDYLQGQTDMNFELSSRGTTDFDIVKNLNGKVFLDIRKGSYKFTGYDVNGSTSEEGKKREMAVRDRRTHFDRAHADFVIRQGVMNTNNLGVEAPVVKSSGSGWLNLPEYTIDLSIRNDFVAVPSITIRIVGDLNNPEVRVPKDKIVSDTVLNILSLPIKSFNFVRDIFK